jgi:hypothetical protein
LRKCDLRTFKEGGVRSDLNYLYVTFLAVISNGRQAGEIFFWAAYNLYLRFLPLVEVSDQRKTPNDTFCKIINIVNVNEVFHIRSNLETDIRFGRLNE